MTLHYGSLYWPRTWPNPPRYPELDGAAECDVLIVGGGMTGAVCGLTLARAGWNAALIEQGEIASGSTSSNTGIIQYANDFMLTQLARRIGEPDAAYFYRACRDAVGQLEEIARSLPRDSGFIRRCSFYFASRADDAPALRQEFEALVRSGFEAEWREGDAIRAIFPFRKDAAIVAHGDAELNPFRFVTAMVEAAARAGLAVYERTPMLSMAAEGGRYAVRTGRGVVRAKNVVMAVGYTPEVAGSGRVKALLNRSYAIATRPLPDLAGWHERMMIWETARPYLYMRTTPDGRIVAGGLDEPLRRPVLSAAELRQRSLRILSEVRKLFPAFELQLDAEWCATFGESADGLPWIGEDPDRPGVYLALGYGGNGTVYSTIAAQLIRDRLAGRHHPLERLVGLARSPAKAAATTRA